LTGEQFMTPYHQLVSNYARLLTEGRGFPQGTFPPAARPVLPPHAPAALFFSPHPDDECIVGGIALRLLRQAKMRLVNVAVTQGSKPERKAERFRELQNACHFLGFDLVRTAPTGLDGVSVKTREQDPARWAGHVNVIRAILEQYRPKVVLCPHDRDWNSTHIGTHFLVTDALRQMPAGFECYLVETEFWGAMTDPNLMVELSAEDLADMMAATTFHLGEISRNPYHLLLPAWMMDNVRRGAEVAGGQGGAAPDFPFAALYRLRKWVGGQALRLFEGGRMVPAGRDIGELFP
jgi:LmbE family N-acetylglucosaminyl deacetylase